MQESRQKSKILFRRPHEEKKQRSGFAKMALAALFFIILFGGIGYGLFFSPLFEAREIAVRDQKGVPLSPALREAVRLSLAGKSRLLMASEQSIKSIITAQFPEVADARIEKNFTERALTVRLSLREMAAIWCKARLVIASPPTTFGGGASATSTQELALNEQQEEISDCFYVDQNGIAFQEAPLTLGALIVLVKDFSGREIILGAEVTEQKLMKFIVNFKDWMAKNSDAAVNEFSVEDEERHLRGSAAEGWYIIFNDFQPAEAQGFIVKKVLEEEIKEKRKDLEYVDLRLENKVYYKLKEEFRK